MTTNHTDRSTGTGIPAPVTTDPRRDTRSRWGRSARLGGGTGRLMGVSLLGGLLGAVLVGAASYLLTQNAGLFDGLRWTTAGVMAFNGLVFGFLLTWVALVEPTTLRGAAKSPEESVESRWYEKATSGAFHDTVAVVGIGLFVISLGGFSPSPALVGIGLLLQMAGSASIRYLIQKRRG